MCTFWMKYTLARTKILMSLLGLSYACSVPVRFEAVIHSLWPSDMTTEPDKTRRVTCFYFTLCTHSLNTNSLASFFTDKICKLCLSLTSGSSTSSSPHSPSSPKTPPDFSTFNPAYESEISKIYSTVPTNNVIPILFLRGFSKNALHSWFLLSLT